MKLNKLFIGDIYTLNKSNLNYGPHFAPLSLSNTTYDISFKKRTLLYKRENDTFIDLFIEDSKKELKDSKNIIDVKINEDFVMIDNNLISFENVLLENNIKRKNVSKCFVKKLVRKFK
ncbi:MAG: hypothetical protein IJE04_01565 [Bacilli bacterium]|nr:hypothetical protein [Bacilli bacterium]